MYLKRSLALFLVCCFMWYSAVCPGAERTINDVPHDVSAQVRTILSELEAGLLSGHEALSALRSLPSEGTIRALLEELSTNPLLRSSQVGRILAYQSLQEHGGIQTEDGFRRFLTCLEEPHSPRGTCAAALLDAPEKWQAETSQRIIEFLTDARIEDSERVQAIRAIGKKGPAANFYLKELHILFTNERGSERLRCAAASATLEIGGLKNIVPHLQRLDSVGVKVALWAVSKFVGQGIERYKEDLPPDFLADLAQVRECVLQMLKHDDLATRRAAFEALFVVFGNVAVVERPNGEYEINPEFLGALEELATSEPDPALRDRARKALENLDTQEMVRKFEARRIPGRDGLPAIDSNEVGEPSDRPERSEERP